MNRTILDKLMNAGVEANAATFLIYSDKKSSRLEYVCEFIFNHVLNCNYKICNQLDEFE